MIITKYICDRCNHEQDTSEQMWHLRVFIDHQYTNARTFAYQQGKREALWCRPCAEKMVLLPSKIEPAPEAPSFEDLLRDIVRDEISNAGP